MRANVILLSIAACAGSASGPKPVIPAIHDHTIVFGQRVGPVSLGMSESQLIDAVGKPTNEQSYGGNRRRLDFPPLKLQVVLDGGAVVFVAPLDGSYATSSGLHVGSIAGDLASAGTHFTKHDRNGTISYCFDDATLVTVAGPGASVPADVCATGTVCDIAIGGCNP
jgi:hypothetical protein